jgi:hypothetical protein
VVEIFSPTGNWRQQKFNFCSTLCYFSILRYHRRSDKYNGCSGVSPFTDSVNKPFFNPRECCKKEDVAYIWIFAELSWILVYFDLGVLGFQLSAYQLLGETSEVQAWGVVTGRVLGLCQLMCLSRNVHGTIPEWAKTSWKSTYPNGIRHTSSKVGIKTSVISILGLKFRR